MNIHVVPVPYYHDVAKWGWAQGPRWILECGLAPALEARGHVVTVAEPVRLPLKERSRDTVWNLGRLGSYIAQAVVREFQQSADLIVALLGDCTHAPGVAGGISQARLGRLGVIWCDAHGDLNTVETTQTGLWGGMPLAVLLGWDLSDWRRWAGLETPVSVDAAVLLGTSDLDPAEREAIARSGLAHLDARELSPLQVRETVTRVVGAADAWYVHVDLVRSGPAPEGPSAMRPGPAAPDLALQSAGDGAQGRCRPLGDPHRFRTAREVTRYTGRDPTVHQSGEADQGPSTIRQGSPFLCRFLVGRGGRRSACISSSPFGSGAGLVIPYHGKFSTRGGRERCHQSRSETAPSQGFSVDIVGRSSTITKGAGEPLTSTTSSKKGLPPRR
jgi:arginase